MASSYHAFDVITPFHAISSLSYCLSLAAAGDAVTLHIVPAMHGRYLLEEMHFVAATGVRVEVVHQTKHSSGRKVLECLMRRWMLRTRSDTEATIFIGHHSYFKPTVLRCLGESLSGRRIRTFSFEEGIGTYHSLAQEREVAAREGKSFYVARYYLKRVLASRILLDYRWGLLGSESKEVRQWHRVAASELARHFYSCEGQEAVTGAVHYDSALFFTSPLVRLGLLNTQENESLILRVREYFQQRGKMLYIKPHPLDQQSYEHLVEPGCVIESRIPAEVYLIQHRYAGVAGVNSGALLTASMMFELCAINFHAWLPEPARQKLTLGHHLRDLFARFTRDCQQGGHDVGE